MTAGTPNARLYPRVIRVTLSEIATGRAYVIEGTSGQRGVTEGLHVSFTAERSRKKKPNAAELTIYNLAPVTRQALLNGKWKCAVAAGFLPQEPVPVVVQGDVDSVEHDRQTPDILTKLKIRDGGAAFSAAPASLALAPPITVAQALAEVARSMDLGLAPLPDACAVEYVGGLTFQGRARDALDELSASVGLGWSIQDGVIEVADPNLPKPRLAPLLSPSAGLIGSPKENRKRGRVTDITAEALFDARYTPGLKIVLRSADIEGTFLIFKAAHACDNFGGAFTSTLTLKSEK